MNKFAFDTARAIVDGSSDAAFAIDRDRTIVSWNTNATDLLNYAADEVVGRRCSDVLDAVYSHGEPLCVPGCGGVDCFRHGKPFTARACLARQRDGGWLAINISSVVLSKEMKSTLPSPAIAVIYMQPSEENPVQRLADCTLRIFAFGRFGLVVDSNDLSSSKWDRKQALTLLKILSAHLGRAVPRDVLIDHLWPSAEVNSGRKRLKAVIYSLRKNLRAAGLSEHIIETTNEAYVLRREGVWVDTKVFEACVSNGDATFKHQQWEEALSFYQEAAHLYRGDYLEEDIHTEWCAEERERLRQIQMELLVNMTECYVQLAKYQEAIETCRNIILKDPCRESAHRTLMRCLVLCGRHESAIAQYDYCQRVLARELDVEPMLETSELYRQVLKGKSSKASAKPRC